MNERYGFTGASRRRLPLREDLLEGPGDHRTARTGPGKVILVVGVLLAAAFAVVASITSESEAYSPHDPILISGDGEFTGPNGVVSGDGSVDNPWIISGWEIVADSAHLIHIRNTLDYYVIANVSVGFESWNTNYAGIYLENAPNGRVENSTAFGKVKTGIHVQGSSNVKVFNNTVTNIGGPASDRYNVYVQSCANDVRIVRNNISSGSYGIYVYYSMQSRIEGNIVSNTEDGAIASFSSRTLTIEGNEMADAGINIWTYGVLAETNTHTITSDNLVDGKPVFYRCNTTGVSIDGDALGQIMLANCSSASIVNVALSNLGNGVLAAYCDNVTISYYRMTNATWHGVSTLYTENLTVEDSTLEECYFGIYNYNN